MAADIAEQLAELGRQLRDHQNQGRLLRRRTRALIPRGLKSGLTHAGIARLLTVLTGERVRQIAEETGTKSPQAKRTRNGEPINTTTPATRAARRTKRGDPLDEALGGDVP